MISSIINYCSNCYEWWVKDLTYSNWNIDFKDEWIAVIASNIVDCYFDDYELWVEDRTYCTFAIFISNKMNEPLQWLLILLATTLIIMNDEVKILPIVLLTVILMVINNKLKILPMELFEIAIENRKN